MARTPTTADVQGRTIAQTGALVIGIVFLAIGVLGFLVTGFDQFFGTDTGETLIGFELNPAHNIVHLLVGGALVAGASRDDRARAVLWIVAVVYAIVGIAGFWLVDTEANVLSLNMADNWLHILTAAVAVGLAVARPASATTGTAATRPDLHPRH
jgi:hypothetical protein